MSSAAVRSTLVDALRLDLIGPRPGVDGHAKYAEERLPTAPSLWYLTGFLAPSNATANTPQTELDESDPEAADRSGADDDVPTDKPAARRAHFPSSLGLSVIVPAAAETLTVEVSWGDYEPIWTTPPDTSGPTKPDEWRRSPRAATLQVPTGARKRPTPLPVPGSSGLELLVHARTVDLHRTDAGASRLPPGARAVSVFLVNNREPATDATRDAAFAFQPELTVRCDCGFIPRPDLRRDSDDLDEQVADLQYRDAFEIAVGHNVSAHAERDPDGLFRTARTDWMPLAEVEKVVPTKQPGAVLELDRLAAAADVNELRSMLAPILSGYEGWLAAQQVDFDGDETRGRTARDLLDQGKRALHRLHGGLDALSDPLAFEAFRLANKVMARAMRQRWVQDHPGHAPEAMSPVPTWRPFQLAFVLLNLAGMADEHHPDRGLVDLLFFPTGGGKTEAYLGLAAFTMLLRRMRDPSRASGGVSVLMRYTLRLLTLDQLGRAATLVCALELERQQDVERLGEWPFEIGLWVGEAATPNRLGSSTDDGDNTARRRTLDHKREPKTYRAPLPIGTCPWCGTPSEPDCFGLLPDTANPKHLRVFCASRACLFHRRQQPLGLPIVAVDDEVYRRLPAFIISTVDKFAALPFIAQTSGLFGRVDRFDAAGYLTPGDGTGGTPLPEGLPPPDLIIQDELHLISGPLGTMVGLYETALDHLASRTKGGKMVRPKIVASTATVRRARSQIRALFARDDVAIFPPPGPNLRDSYFAETKAAHEVAARQYLGIAAPGRNGKLILLRTYLALLGAAQKAFEDAGGAKNTENPADPYRTILGYFNALRELGGSRRIVEDEVYSQAASLGTRRRRVGETSGLFSDRTKLREPRELTSRVSTGEVAETRRQLGLAAHDDKGLDVALATNMISVGLDVTRLGLMVVLGQPKTTAEYIQSTSRVGRDDKRPGLVVTLLNVHKPRDRSHYERFRFWHETFYRAVEATSVTPFSARAVDRGLAGVTVSLARHGIPDLTEPRGAERVLQHSAELDAVADVLADRAARHAMLPEERTKELRSAVRERARWLLDRWIGVANDQGILQYAREAGAAPNLLFDPLDPERLRKDHGEAFKAARSLRDVETSVPVWVEERRTGRS